MTAVRLFLGTSGYLVDVSTGLFEPILNPSEDDTLANGLGIPPRTIQTQDTLTRIQAICARVRKQAVDALLDTVIPVEGTSHSNHTVRELVTHAHRLEIQYRVLNGLTPVP